MACRLVSNSFVLRQEHTIMYLEMLIHPPFQGHPVRQGVFIRCNINHVLRQVYGFNIDIYIILMENSLKPVTCCWVAEVRAVDFTGLHSSLQKEWIHNHTGHIIFMIFII